MNTTHLEILVGPKREYCESVDDVLLEDGLLRFLARPARSTRQCRLLPRPRRSGWPGRSTHMAPVIPAPPSSVARRSVIVLAAVAIVRRVDGVARGAVAPLMMRLLLIWLLLLFRLPLGEHALGALASAVALAALLRLDLLHRGGGRSRGARLLL